MEDLGEGGSLADLLLGDDAARAEAGLVQFAVALGRLHAATIGQMEEWDRLLVEFGASAADIRRSISDVSKEMPEKLRSVRGTLGVPTSAAVDEEAVGVLAAVSNPGPFLAFVIGDTCPDHHRYDANGHLRFFDFEGCGYRHALLDAAVGRMPFPSCWCVNRLPDLIPPRMEAAYRAELVTGCPEAAEDAIFCAALVDACAWWMLALVTTYWPLAEALHEDRRWGIATMRQRQLLRLDTFATATEVYGHRPALGELAFETAAQLRAPYRDGVSSAYFSLVSGSAAGVTARQA